MGPEPSGCPADVGRRRAGESSPVAPAEAGSCSSVTLLAGLATTPGDPRTRSAATSRRPLPPPRRGSSPAASHAREYRCARPCPRADRSGTSAPGACALLREKDRTYRQACLLARHSRFASTPRRGRLEMKLLRQVSDFFRRFQTPVHRLPCSASEACRKAGPFAPPELPGFSAIMALSDFPPGPPSLPRTAEWRTPPAGTSLSAPRSPCTDMPCPLPRRTEPVRLSVASRLVRPSPYLRRVGVRDFPCEACSGLLRVTACRLARPAFPGLCHQASARPITRPHCSSASLLTDNYTGGLLPPTGCPRRKGALRKAG